MKFADKLEKIRNILGFDKSTFCEDVLKRNFSAYNKIQNNIAYTRKSSQEELLKNVREYLLKKHNKKIDKCLSILQK